MVSRLGREFYVVCAVMHLVKSAGVVPFPRYAALANYLPYGTSTAMPAQWGVMVMLRGGWWISCFGTFPHIIVVGYYHTDLSTNVHQ